MGIASVVFIGDCIAYFTPAHPEAVDSYIELFSLVSDSWFQCINV